MTPDRRTLSWRPMDAAPDPPDTDLSMRVGRVAAPVREQALDILREAILDFRYKPGQRLIERELVEQIGVSRTTIREVLRELDAEGLVKTIPQKGAVVVIPSPTEAAQIYEVRGALEALAARAFVERASAAQLDALRDAADGFRRAVDAGADIQTLLREKDQFYAALVEGAGNDTVRSILATLQARVRMLRSASLSQPGRSRQAVAEIDAVVTAIASGNARDAERACRAHVEHAATAGTEAVAASASETAA